MGLTLALAACATRTTGPQLPSVEPAAPPPPPHLAVILGHGDYRTPSGGHGTCAGQSVALMHETTTYRRRIVALYGSSEHALLPVAEVQSRSAKLGPATENPLVDSVQCRPDGGFTFHDLQPGSYFLIARTHQGKAPAPAGEFVVMDRVVLNPGEYRDVDLTP
jgi:hypothetical protein